MELQTKNGLKIKVATVELVRMEKIKDSMMSVIYVNGKYFCKALENNNFLIKEDTYEIVNYIAPKNGDCFRLIHPSLNGFYLIHPANHAHELRGCIALGVSNMGGVLNYSKTALNQLKSALKGHHIIELIVRKFNSSDTVSF